MTEVNHPYDQDIQISEIKQNEYQLMISPNWSINGVPDGGYLMAMMAGAMQPDGEPAATQIITANYPARCVPGEAKIAVEKTGQSIQFQRFLA